MNDKVILSQEKIKFKSFQYQTELNWLGRRTALIRSEGKAAFRVSSPPEFKGEAGVWTPEHLFVAAVETCTMTTFVAFAERKNIPIVSYRSFAEGWMENVEGTYQFTKIILKPRIVITPETPEEDVRSVLEQAHEKCFIANSIRSSVILAPNIVVERR